MLGVALLQQYSLFDLECTSIRHTLRMNSKEINYAYVWPFIICPSFQDKLIPFNEELTMMPGYDCQFIIAIEIMLQFECMCLFTAV